MALLTAALLSGGAVENAFAQENPLSVDQEIAALRQRLDAQEKAMNEMMRTNGFGNFMDNIFKVINVPYSADSHSDVFGRMNVADEKDKITVTIEMAGMDKENIDIELKDYVLTVRGEKKETQKVKEGDYFVQERQFGTFNRSVSLPENIDINKISSQFKNGVLTIVVPKTEIKEPEVKKIKID